MTSKRTCLHSAGEISVDPFLSQRPCARCGEKLERQTDPTTLFWCGAGQRGRGVDEQVPTPPERWGEQTQDDWTAEVPVTSQPRFPDHVVLDTLGLGGGGVVYRAMCERSSTKVALKVLRAGSWAGPVQRTRFQREMQVAQRLRDPGVVRVHDSGTTQDGVPWYSMELIEGPTLRQLLVDERQPPLPLMVALLTEVAHTLARLHQQGVVHRDVKPENVLITQDGRPLLADFGIALCDDGARLTRASRHVGTPRYMAPEQLGGEVRDWTRVDVYALGRILEDILERQQAVGSLRRAPLALRWIAARATVADPDDRFPSMARLAEELQRWRRGQILPSSDQTLRWARAMGARRSVKLASALIIGAALLGALGVDLFERSRGANQAHAEWAELNATLDHALARGDRSGALLLLERYLATTRRPGHPGRHAALVALSALRRDFGQADRALLAAVTALEEARSSSQRAEAFGGLSALLVRYHRWDVLSRLIELHDREGWGLAPGDSALRAQLALAFGALDERSIPEATRELLAGLARGRRLDEPGGERTFPFLDDPGLAGRVVQVDGLVEPERTATGWRVPAGWRIWRGGDGVGELLVRDPSGRVLALGQQGARELLDRDPADLVELEVVEGRVFAMGLGVSRGVMELVDGTLRQADPSSAQLYWHCLGLEHADLDGDGVDELIAGLGNPEGFGARVWGLTEGGLQTRAMLRLGQTRLLTVLPRDGERAPRLVMSRLNTHPSSTVMGPADPQGGTCGVELVQLGATGLELVQDLPFREPRQLCPHAIGRVADVDGDGSVELLVGISREHPSDVSRTLLYRIGEDGLLMDPTHLGIGTLLSVAQLDEDLPVEVLVDLEGPWDDGRWVLGVGESLPPRQPRPALIEVLDPPPCGRLALQLGLPMVAAEACDALASEGETTRAAALAGAARAWLDAGDLDKALVDVESACSGADESCPRALHDEIWRHHHLQEPLAIDEHVHRCATEDLVAIDDALASARTSLDLGFSLPSGILRPLPGATIHDVMAGTLTVRVPAGSGPVLTIPLEATGEPPWLSIAGTWRRAEWASHLRFSLRPVGGQGASIRLFTLGGQDFLTRAMNGACSWVALDAALNEPTPISMQIWWREDGSLDCATVLGELQQREIAPDQVERLAALARPVPGTPWELVIEGAEPLQGALGQISEIELSEIDLGGMVLAHRPSPERSAWTLWALGMGPYPGARPPSEDDHEQIALRWRLDPSLAARVSLELGAAEAGQVFERAWGINARMHPHDPQTRDAPRFAPELGNAPQRVRSTFAPLRGSALASMGQLALAREVLEGGLRDAAPQGGEGWRDGLRSAALLAEFALFEGDEAEAIDRAREAVAWAPDQDLGRRMVRNRPRISAYQGRPGWEFLDEDATVLYVPPRPASGSEPSIAPADR